MFTYEAVPKNTESSDGVSYGVPSSSGAMTSSSQAPPTFARQNTKFVRKAANETWVDDTLQEWPENDYRIFVGDLGKEVNTEMLTKHFQPLFKSFAKAKVIKAQNETKSKGYGFVSFLDPNDCLRAVKELNGKYLGSR
jgi:RNA recognition motif-containing protein